MSIENIYCYKSRKSLSQQLLLDAFLFRFHFVYALQYLNGSYSKYLVNQTAYLYLKLSLKHVSFIELLLLLES